MVRSAALLLAGHGSEHGPDASAPVYAHAARIRRRRLFDEVQVAFWKQDPRLRDARGRLRSQDVFVVPMFLAEGYYTREVVPRELGLDGEITRDGSRLIRYCAPVGAHPSMDDLVLRRARRTARLTVAQRRRAGLIVIGHGTDRSATSAAVVQRVTARLRARSEYRLVDCGFLDQEPRIDRVLAGTDAAHIVLVPFFLAEAWHTRETIPNDLGLDGPRTERETRVLWYTPPIGTLPEVAWAAVDIARGHL